MSLDCSASSYSALEGRTSGQLAETAAVHEQALSAGGSSGSVICIRTCQQGTGLGLGKNWVSGVEKVFRVEFFQHPSGALECGILWE